MKPGEPLIQSLEAIRSLRRQKFNPLRNLKPERLVSVLENWEIGHLRDGALLFETIADRDDTIKSVKPKREKEVSQLDKQVVALPGTGEAGDRHREILEDFWTNVRTTNSYDRNERGGFRRLVKQMMTATSFRYAAHHIVWQPGRGRIRATFEFVPLWLFENLTGTLRYLRDPWTMEGELLDPREWMVTYGDGLMVACSIGYLAKRSAFNDWLIFSEKFSVPGVLGRTTAKKDSDEGRAMRAAVESFGHDWTGVIYGDDGSHEKPIDIIQATGNPSGMPMPAVVERVDRKFAALYRGADLSSMSSGASTEGAGASLQGKEKDILLADDAETINETLAEVSRMVIEWYDGRGADVLAKVELIVPTDENEEFYLKSVESITKLGVRVSKDAVLERLGIQEASDEEQALGEVLSGAESTVRQDVANSDLQDELASRISGALSVDLQPLGKALADALQAGDEVAFGAALQKISDRMPEFLETEVMTEILEDEMMLSLLGGHEEEANGDLPGHPFRGNQHRGWSREGETRSLRDSLGPLPEKGRNLESSVNLQRLHAALSRCLSLKRDVPRAAFREGLGQVDLTYGRPGNPAIAYADGYGVAHILAKHGKLSLDAVPEIIANGAVHKHDRRDNKRYVSLGSRLVIIGRKDARHSWVISSFEDVKKTNQLQGG